MKNTPNRNKAAAILRAYLDARRELPYMVNHPVAYAEARSFKADTWRAYLCIRGDMTKAPEAIYTRKDGGEEKGIALNPGDYFGKVFNLYLPFGNFGFAVAVEADNLSDALDILSESKYGFHIREENPTEESSFDGKGNAYSCEGIAADQAPVTYRCEGLPDLSPVKFYARAFEFVDASHS